MWMWRDSSIIQPSESLKKTCKNGTASFFLLCLRFGAFAGVNRRRKRVRCRLLVTLKYGRLSWLWPLTGGTVNLRKSMGRPSAGLPRAISFRYMMRKDGKEKRGRLFVLFLCTFSGSRLEKKRSCNIVIRSADNDSPIVFPILTWLL